jgi:4-hydroxy-4-methyl-2-oxoglutarate aldolase
MDGLARGIEDVREMQSPAFHAGVGHLNSKGPGQVIAIDGPVECAAVLITPGDFILSDADGCVIIPKKIEAEVLAAARDKLKAGKHTQQAFIDHAIVLTLRLL